MTWVLGPMWHVAAVLMERRAGKCPLRASLGKAGPSPGCLGTPAALRQPPGSLPGGSPVAAGTAGLRQGDSYAQLLGANGHLHGSQGFGFEKGIRMICTDFHFHC